MNYFHELRSVEWLSQRPRDSPRICGCLRASPIIVAEDKAASRNLPSPKRGAIPTPKEEIERAPKYKPSSSQEQDKPPKSPAGDNNRQARPESLFDWIEPETRVQPHKCSGFRTAGSGGSYASINDHQLAKVI